MSTAEATFGDLEAPRRQVFSTAASLVVSGLLHVGLVAALLSTSIFHAQPLLEQQTIHVKLARIGTPRDKKLLPRRPTQNSAAAAPIQVGAKPVFSTHSAKLTDQKSKRKNSLQNALAKLQNEVQEEQTGQLDGFQNGTDDVTEGDLYWARVVDRIKRFYVVPNTIPQSERAKLVADVQITIAGDGTILNIQTQTSSGNPIFDRAIEAAVKKCRALPAPPANLAQQAREGVVLEFRSAEM